MFKKERRVFDDDGDLNDCSIDVKIHTAIAFASTITGTSVACNYV